MLWTIYIAMLLIPRPEGNASCLLAHIYKEKQLPCQDEHSGGGNLAMAWTALVLLMHSRDVNKGKAVTHENNATAVGRSLYMSCEVYFFNAKLLIESKPGFWEQLLKGH